MNLTTSLTGASMLELEVLISELLSINGFASTTISKREISTLHSKYHITSIHITRQDLHCATTNKPLHHQTCSINCGIMRWNLEPLKWSGFPLLPTPFSPADGPTTSEPCVQYNVARGRSRSQEVSPVLSARKFSATGLLTRKRLTRR